MSYTSTADFISGNLFILDSRPLNKMCEKIDDLFAGLPVGIFKCNLCSTERTSPVLLQGEPKKTELFVALRSAVLECEIGIGGVSLSGCPSVRSSHTGID